MHSFNTCFHSVQNTSLHCRVTRTCVNIGRHLFGQWLVAFSAPSHYLNQLWLIINRNLRNKFMWNLTISIQENECENLNVLNEIQKSYMPQLSLRWCHHGVSNRQPHDCLLNHLFRHRSKKTSKLRVTGLCAGNSPVTGEFPAQRASNAENISILWRHHVRFWANHS